MKKPQLFLATILLLSFAAILYCPHESKATTYYTYTLIGPYYDDGTVVNNGQTGVTVLYANDTITRFWMNNTGTNVNTTTIVSTNQALEIIWTASVPLNYSRVYYLLPSAVNDTIYVHVLSTVYPAYLYTFNVADFYGMQNPYLESTVSNGSMTQIVERLPLAVTGVATFSMAQYGPYGLTFVCDQGTYSQSFTAGAVYTNSLNVVSGMFPYTNATSIEAYAQAERINTTAVGVVYNDPTNTTTALSIVIYHKHGLDLIYDYSDITPSNLTTLVWNSGFRFVRAI